MKLLIILLLTIAPLSLHAKCKLIGKAINVTDGDTFTLLDRAKKQHKIRLAGIDAPERSQPFGKKAKQYLNKLVVNKWVCVNWNKKGKYGRTIGKVLIGGRDINLDMIKVGLAWHFKKYQHEQSKQDQRLYAEIEVDAQLATIGLWSQHDYIQPWKWRKGARKVKQYKKAQPKTSNTGQFVCGTKRYCKEMVSCAEARAYLKCGLVRLDRDRDGIPCESLCGH